MPSRAVQLFALGQSVWLDFIRRGHLVSGEFDSLVREESVSSGLSPAVVEDYLRHALHFELDAGDLEGLAAFYRLAAEDG